MFQKHNGESWETPFTIKFNGGMHDVKLRFTRASQAARDFPTPGSTEHGQHAKRNVGVSILRAGRELEMSQAWTIAYDPTERWWGAEIEFPPSLDELFGVSNNKQSARYLTDAATFDVEQSETDDRSFSDIKTEMEESEDPLLPLIELSRRITNTLRQIRSQIGIEQRGHRAARRRHDPTSAEAQATAATRVRQSEGFRGESDKDEDLPADQRKEEMQKALEDLGMPKEAATELSATTINDGLKYIFTQADVDTSAFFTVRLKAGAILITLNVNHPAYDHLVAVLDPSEESTDPLVLSARLDNASRGLKLLLGAWARFEDETMPDSKRNELQDIRVDWGRVARRFLAGES